MLKKLNEVASEASKLLSKPKAKVEVEMESEPSEGSSNKVLADHYAKMAEHYASLCGEETESE